MKRDDLPAHLSSLPADAEVGVMLGTAHLDIADVSPWGEGVFVALECHEADLRDVLAEWGISSGRREEMVRRTPGQEQGAA